ncbi:DELLA protein RGL1-like [Andrographis paniculata]|uniref:DELLA protein RGL1-like n=1 Tax=Andrographis paniculata TaxID=175694 RepID=UPI0021E7793D|nr:DELLA protein RGL1-like [Andrographis paniculata]
MAFRKHDGGGNGDDDKSKNPKTCPLQAAFGILNKYGVQPKKNMRRGQVSEARLGPVNSRDLRPETIVKMAKMKTNDEKNSSSLSPENINDISLARSLLSAAEMFDDRHFDGAKTLLRNCILQSSLTGNSVTRVVRLFAEALTERIDVEMGKIDLGRIPLDIEESLIKYQNAIVVTGQRIPSAQVTQFAAIQTILDHVATAKKIHLLEFGINYYGFPVSIMIQGLANRKDLRVELLAVSTVGTSTDRLRETGERLATFAKSMNVPFLFKSVVSETELTVDSFDFQPDEAVIVYLGLHLWSLLASPNHLQSFLHFVKKVNPRLIIVNELETSTNTPIYGDRFHEALVFFLAIFDCLDGCLKGDHVSRKAMEEVFYRDMIRNIVVAEDEERTHRHEKIAFWRRLFSEFDIVEVELSDSSLYQASLLIKGNQDWKDSCTLKMDRESLIVEWKGTSIQSISAWKIVDGRGRTDHN